MAQRIKQYASSGRNTELCSQSCTQGCLSSGAATSIASRHRLCFIRCLDSPHRSRWCRALLRKASAGSEMCSMGCSKHWRRKEGWKSQTWRLKHKGPKGYVGKRGPKSFHHKPQWPRQSLTKEFSLGEVSVPAPRSAGGEGAFTKSHCQPSQQEPLLLSTLKMALPVF